MKLHKNTVSSHMLSTLSLVGDVFFCDKKKYIEKNTRNESHCVLKKTFKISQRYYQKSMSIKHI